MMYVNLYHARDGSVGSCERVHLTEKDAILEAEMDFEYAGTLTDIFGLIDLSPKFHWGWHNEMERRQKEYARDMALEQKMDTERQLQPIQEVNYGI